MPPPARFTACAVLVVAVSTAVTLSTTGWAAEVYQPKRPKELDQVVTVGEEVGRMLDESPGELEPAEKDPGRGGWSFALAFLFGTVGFSYFIYGKKQSNFTVLGCGAVLMVFPYLVADPVLIAVIGVLLCAGPALLSRMGVN